MQNAAGTILSKPKPKVFSTVVHVTDWSCLGMVPLSPGSFSGSAMVCVFSVTGDFEPRDVKYPSRYQIDLPKNELTHPKYQVCCH